MGGRFWPWPWACCSSMRSERTSSDSGTLIQRLWNSDSCDIVSRERVRTMVFLRCARKKGLFSRTTFIDTK